MSAAAGAVVGAGAGAARPGAPLGARSGDALGVPSGATFGASSASAGAAPGRAARAGVALAVAAGVALLFATGNPAAAVLPAALAAAGYALLRLPVRVPLFAVLGLAMLADLSPSRLPDEAPWNSPVAFLQPLLLENLNKLLGVEALKVSGVEVLALGLGALALLRAMAGDRTDAAGRGASARPMLVALALAFGAVLLMEAWGVARGGDARQSLWQFRYLLWMPVLALLLCAATRGPRDAARFAGVVTAVSCVKILIGGYYYLAVARPLGGEAPATATSHADSVLFVVTMAGWLAAAYHRPTAGRIAFAAALSAWTFFGLVVNNRRTAYVTLAATGVMFYALLPRRTRRALTRAALCAAPVFALYVAAGRNHTTGVFGPAGKIVSVITQDDASSQTRDIENFNLLTTLKQHPLVGSGWGHEYVELVRAVDISAFFAQYRFIAHNSVLWLWSIGGLLGFTLLWMPVAVGAFLAARAHAFARTPLERTLAYAALATYVAYTVQAWSDMGTQSWTVQGMLAAALAASAKLAVRTGAWPQGTRLLGAAAPRVGPAARRLAERRFTARGPAARAVGVGA